MIIVYCFIACLCGYLASLKVAWLNLTSKTSPLNPIGWTSVNSAKSITAPQLPIIRSGASQIEEGSRDVVRPNLGSPIAPTKPKRVIVAMTGATGAILGIRLLEKLARMNVETHLIISKWAGATISYETDYKLREVRALATKVYSAQDMAAPVSSGSFKVDAMIVIPCSMKTLSSVASGYGDDLISRAADVSFKERRRLILVVRETPLSGIHIENLMKVTQNGAIICPPVPAFYTKPKTVDDIIDQTVGRILDLVDIDTGDFERWTGMAKVSTEIKES